MTEWAEIVEGYGQVVWRSAYRLLGGPKDAADCFVETFVSAAQVLERRAASDISVLLARLATAKSIERLRRRYRRGAGADAVDLVYVPKDELGRDDQIQTRELVGQLQKALCRLPAQEAEVFCLHYLNDFSPRQIGKELGIDGKTANILAQRSRRKLSQFMESKDKGAGIVDEAIGTLRREPVHPGRPASLSNRYWTGCRQPE